MDNRIEEQEKALLSLIDRYNKESEKDRLYFLKYKKNNPNSGLNKEPFLTFYSQIEISPFVIEITDFLYHFGNIHLLKTFHYSHHAESLIEGFEKLSLPIPHFILECQKEVIYREGLIKGYFKNEKFNWSQSQKEIFLSDLQKEVKTHSFDHKSEKEYLKKKFEETILETRDIEKEIKVRFGYLVEKFFDGENFSLSKDDLNEYFYHSEIVTGGCRSSFEVLKMLDRYVNKKNEVSALRNFLRGERESNKEGKKEIKNTFNSQPIEQIRDHFKGLIEKLNPRKKVWMTKEDFEKFIKRSFEGKTKLKKPKINIGYGGKFALVKLFYNFYQYCQNENLTENRSKDPFIELLKNAFDTNNFDDITNGNFKGNLSKYNWN